MTILLGIVFVVLLLFGLVVFFGAPYVPSKPSDLKVAFDDLYKLKPKDVVVDIGSGDGMVLREVSRRGARAVGYELNPILVLISRLLSRHDKKVEVRLANLWQAHFPDDTTVVYIFGVTRDISRMIAKVQREATRLGRPISIISYGFHPKLATPTRQAGAHFLYEVLPLHKGRA